MAKPQTEASNFEESLERLENIVAELERGDIPLERSLELYEQGTKLTRLCEDRLRKAEERITALTSNSGSGAALPLDDEEPDQLSSASEVSDDDIPF